MPYGSGRTLHIDDTECSNTVIFMHSVCTSTINYGYGIEHYFSTKKCYGTLNWRLHRGIFKSFMSLLNNLGMVSAISLTSKLLWQAMKAKKQ